MQDRQPIRGTDQSSESVVCIYEELVYVRGSFTHVSILRKEGLFHRWYQTIGTFTWNFLIGSLPHTTLKIKSEWIKTKTLKLV